MIYIASEQRGVGAKDHTVHPELARIVAKRMGATTFETDSRNVPILFQPDLALDVIRKAGRWSEAVDWADGGTVAASCDVRAIGGRSGRPWPSMRVLSPFRPKA